VVLRRPLDTEGRWCLLGVRGAGAGAVPDLRLRRRQATIPEAPHWIRYVWGLILPVFPGVLRSRWPAGAHFTNSGASIYYFSVFASFLWLGEQKLAYLAGKTLLSFFYLLT